MIISEKQIYMMLSYLFSAGNIRANETFNEETKKEIMELYEDIVNQQSKKLIQIGPELSKDQQ